ncbi:citrate synthase [Rhizoctonia solani AG-1 IA]|uniref:Citrate synthase n=1 Tax=Thanatephorus cucumeris (strain AG1-IA) TaxID=983506 RepID=L8X847_THACA|nr:citrate synthase [Rhizoctonia solani AG-1 IA]
MFASSLRSRTAFVTTKGASSIRYASTKVGSACLSSHYAPINNLVTPDLEGDSPRGHSRQTGPDKGRTTHAGVKVGDVKIENVIGGMRGLKAMLWEGSVLDPNEVRKFPTHITLLSRGLMNGWVGDPVSRSLHSRLPKGAAPCTWGEGDYLGEYFAISLVLWLNVASSPITLLSSWMRIKKADYWEPVLEDSLDLVAKLPALAARIYRNTYKPEAQLPPVDKNLDLVGNYVNMLGYGDNKSLTEYLRLYIALHGDHEGGNVSAHTSHLVGSALSDPYLSYSAALLGLAGPLHGLANQEVLRWMLEMQKAVGEDPSHDQIKEYLWKTLKSGQVVPGYGHGVLRKPDPRFIALQQFSATRAELKDSPIIKLVNKTSEVAPGVLTEHGKAKSVHPNVDAVSGCLLYHYGLTQFKYYTVIFGVSRVLGCVSQLVWDRALGLPIERPKSVSMADLQKIVGSA